MLQTTLETRATTSPSFVDLRQFAKEAGTGPAPQTITQEDAFLACRYPLELPPGPVEVGAIRLQAGVGTVANLEGDEFVIVCEGLLTLTRQGETLELTDGASAVLSAGVGFDWCCAESATLLYMRYRAGTAGEGKLIPIDESAPLVTSGTPAAELLIGPTPHCRNHTDYQSANGEFICGTWDSTPYLRRHMTFRHYELMHLLQGAVKVEDHTGASHTFVTGDIFLMEQQAHCSWESHEQVKKVYAIYRPVS
ncbi:cupin domain-containing protein [Marinobacterium ramblicola]|uniref:cupin domain-containing protein n=1 Tax=Marinobacterium ramblicola TaxID=2849041 RepID=UPI001FEB9426|nr:cupin domain-containing protein [Marinobacterium ramblicola]